MNKSEKSREDKPKFDTMTIVGIIIIIITISVFIYYSFFKEKVSLDIGLEFGRVPGNYLKSFSAFSVHSVLNESENERILNINEKLKDYKIHLTVFVPLDSDISEIRDEVSVQAMGYFGEQDKPLSLEEQESSMKKLFKARGFIPINLFYNYDTLVAGENLNYDFILVPGDGELLHPQSPLGGEMDIMAIPMQNNGQVNLFYVGGEIDEKFLEELSGSESIWTPSIVDLVDWIKKTEKMQARLTTNYRDFRTDIEFTGIINDTKIQLNTELKPKNIFNGYNESLNISYRLGNNSVWFVLNENNKYVSVLWKKP